MFDVFPFDMFPKLQNLERDFFIYSPHCCSFLEAMVSAGLKYRPGVYMVYDYSSDELGECLYVGESGIKRGEIGYQQLPTRILDATCKLPSQYPDCNGKRNLRRHIGWTHMMEHDKISRIVFYLFYCDLFKNNGKLSCAQDTVQLQNYVIKVLRDNGETAIRWAANRTIL